MQNEKCEINKDVLPSNRTRCCCVAVTAEPVNLLSLPLRFALSPSHDFRLFGNLFFAFCLAEAGKLSPKG